MLLALQRTWAAYKDEVEEEEEGVDGMSSLEPARLIPAQDLVEGFGEGYGDMSEALASITNELSESSNQAAVKIAELIVLVPLSALEGTWPTPAMAWEQVTEWQATEKPIIAVDLSLPAVTHAGSRHLAQLWIPQARSRAVRSDLGPGHRLVALVCYMWDLRHYVTFCRRQQEDTRCLFFNDLPGLTHGAPRDVDWQDVPGMCYQYALTPRLALYESLGAAEEVVRTLRSSTARNAAVSSHVPAALASQSAGADAPRGVATGLAPGGARESSDACRQQ